MVIDMLLNQLLGIFFGFSSDILSTYNLLVAGCISMMVLIKVSSPLNLIRKILCIVCVVLFVGGVLLFGGFFSVTSVFQWRMLFVLPIIAITYPLMNIIMIFMRRFAHGRKKLVPQEE